MYAKENEKMCIIGNVSLSITISFVSVQPHADGYRTGQSKQLVSGRSSAHLTTPKLDSPTDNYEEVEMDIDSSCSSPCECSTWLFDLNH